MVDVTAIATSLELGPDGVWYPQTGEGDDVSYPADGNSLCFQVEESSFWFNHRNDCIAALVKANPPPSTGPIFDIGGGNGFVCLGLRKAGFDVVLVEPGRSGAINAKKRDIPNVICATTAQAGFLDASMSAIGLFDVIEHIEDDGQFVESMRRLLVNGGKLYATVPAYEQLWSSEDEDAGHFRRYTRPQIETLLRQNGFEIDYSTYIFRPLPVPVLLARTLPYRFRLSSKTEKHRVVERDHRPANPAVASAIKLALRGEVENIARRRAMAFGGSVLIAATAV